MSILQLYWRFLSELPLPCLLIESRVCNVLAASSACFFPFFLPPPTPNRPCQSERSPKARHEADSLEPAEWSERLTPRQSGWLGAAAEGSIPALALSLFLQRLNFLLLLQRLYLSLRAVRSAAILFFVLRRFVLPAYSACFFPFFLPPPNPQSTVSVRTLP